MTGTKAMTEIGYDLVKMIRKDVKEMIELRLEGRIIR